MFLTISVMNPRTAPEQSAYDRWMSQTADREHARIDRCAGGAVVQGMLMGSVTVVIALLMLLLTFFDHPHGDGVGRLRPTAMERTIRVIDTQLQVAGVAVTPPCDEYGNAR
jgi:hypothetical protein